MIISFYYIFFFIMFYPTTQALYYPVNIAGTHITHVDDECFLYQAAENGQLIPVGSCTYNEQTHEFYYGQILVEKANTIVEATENDSDVDDDILIFWDAHNQCLVYISTTIDHCWTDHDDWLDYSLDEDNRLFYITTSGDNVYLEPFLPND